MLFLLTFFIFASKYCKKHANRCKNEKNIQQTWKRKFGPEFGVCSTQTLFKIYNIAAIFKFVTYY